MSNPLFRGFTPQAMEARCRGRMLERRVGIVTDFLNGQPGLDRGPVLDLGAGTGQVMSLAATRFPGVRFTGVEPVGEYVRYAQKTYAAVNSLLDYREGTAELSGLVDKSVVAAYSVNIWHHVDAGRLKTSAEAVAHVLKDGGTYLVVEPNFRHPYVATYQAWTRGERCFVPWRELKILKEFFTVEEVSFYFAFPEFMRTLSPGLTKVEAVLERCPFLAGSVAYLLRKR
jgi:SAM-dependent methyltransferase